MPAENRDGDWPLTEGYKDIFRFWKEEVWTGHSYRARALTRTLRIDSGDSEKEIENFHLIWKASVSERRDILSCATVETSEDHDELRIVFKDSQSVEKIMPYVVFKGLSPSIKNELSKTFLARKYKIYDNLIRKEAIRLELHPQDVMPRTEIKEGAGFCDFANLSNYVFDLILDKLEIYDVSICMCVCQNWREMGKRFMEHARRVEHSLYTHCIRRTRWLELYGDFRGPSTLKDWISVGTDLVRWTIGSSRKLETLHLSFPVNGSVLRDLIASTPHLRHLVCIVPDDHTRKELENILVDTSLESLVVMDTDAKVREVAEDGNANTSRLEIIVPQTLKVLCGTHDQIKGHLDHRRLLFDRESVRLRIPDLVVYEDSLDAFPTIEEIDMMSPLKLKYLSIGKMFQLSSARLNSVLRKCNELVVLVLEGIYYHDGDTIDVLSSSCPNLCKALLNIYWMQWDSALQKLIKWNTALKKKPEAYEVEIRILDPSRNTIQDHEALSPNIRFLGFDDVGLENRYKFSMWHPYVRRLIGLEF